MLGAFAILLKRQGFYSLAVKNNVMFVFNLGSTQVDRYDPRSSLRSFKKSDHCP